MTRIVEFTDIPLNQLEIGKSQVRLSDVGKGIDELADSISKVGLLEPIVVAPQRPNGKYEIILGQRRFLAHQEIGLKTIKAGILSDRVTDGKYEIILGQRRFLAHQEIGLKTIKAGILSDHVTEIEAKVLSVTENLMRRDLNRKDLIDVCTYLYKQYGTMRDVATETGLPYNKVREYVKYDRLTPELKQLVDNSEVDLKAALRAQDASSVSGVPDPQETVKLAKGLSGMSSAQQKKVEKELEEDPTESVDTVINRAKGSGKVLQVVVTLGQQAHASLQSFAHDEGTVLDDAAAQLIEEGLINKGYDTDRGIE